MAQTQHTVEMVNAGTEIDTHKGPPDPVTFTAIVLTVMTVCVEVHRDRYV